jgi:hypothetical protein
MLGVLFAPTAVFRDIQSVWIVFLVLHGCVIATFAIATSQGEYDSIVFIRHVLKPLALLFFWTECRPKSTDKKDPLPGVKHAFYRLLFMRVNKRVYS